MQIAIQKEEPLKSLYTFLLAGLLGCSFLVSGILVFYSCRYSYYPQVDTSQEDILFRDNVGLHAAVILAAVLLFWQLDKRIFRRLSEKLQNTVCRSVLAVTAVLLFGAGTILVHTSPYYPVGDQLNTTAGAYYCMNGNYIMLQPGGYIGLYQQQKGLMFLYEILFSLFGAFCYGAAQQFHVIFMVLTLVAGYGCLKNFSSEGIYRIIFCLLMLFCMPFMIFMPYIYGDVPSICFCTLLFWALSAYGKKLQKRYLAAACVAAALSLMCRMNTWIVLIAVGIGMVLMAMERENYRPLAAGLCIILAAAGTIKAVDAMYEYRSGYESNIGIPSILWIAMGMQETDGQAGVYNRYQQTVFEECAFDQALAAQIGKEYIVQRLKIFKDNPAMTRDFFREKMLSQWMEPLFESLAATQSFGEEPVTGWFYELYYGRMHDVVWKGANYYQSLVYAGLWLCMMARARHLLKNNGNSIGWIPMIAMIGGFLFSLIWENQSRYCLPYYVFMLLYVPEGIIQAGRWVDGLLTKIGRREAKEQEQGKSELRKVS